MGSSISRRPLFRLFYKNNCEKSGVQYPNSYILIIYVDKAHDVPDRFSGERLWVALAEAQRALGLAITEAQIAAMRDQVDAIDFEAAGRYERRFRHDVMAHIHTLGDAAPEARPIIHLGATSCFVTDNADLILIRAALGIVRDKAVAAIDALATFAEAHKGLPCLRY